ncbi:MAG: FAD-dependent oxidoreductase, partial [Minwuia sp.]|nr:FAD-dependent oxidoreductase [Minwuia sp.]
AWYLAQRGLSVVVCEKGRVAGEQSSRNWGFVRQQGRDPAEIPLMMESNRIWRTLERDLNADLEWTVGGHRVV